MSELDLNRLFAEYAQPLFGFLVYRTGDRNLAEDLVADTFERAVRGGRRFDRRRGSEKTWLYAIALNCLRDHLRQVNAESRALQRHGVDEQTDPDWLLLIESRDELGRALKRLSREEREVIALRYGGGLTIPEVARVLDAPVTTVEGRAYRALRKLRIELDAAPPERGSAPRPG